MNMPGGLFGQAYLGYGKDDLRARRTGVVEDLSGSPDGNHFTAGAKGGYLMPFGGLRSVRSQRSITRTPRSTATPRTAILP